MTSRVLLRRTLLLPLLMASFAACSDDDGPSGTGGSFTLGQPSGTVTVVPGGTAVITIPTNRSGGNTVPVTLSAADVPAGYTVTFNPGVVQAGVTQAQVIVRAPATATAGEASFTVRAMAEGMTTQTTTVNITTTAAAGTVTANFTTDTSIVQRGSSVTVNIPITRTEGFTGPVSVFVDSVPAGISWTTTATTGDVATVTFTTAYPAPARVNLLPVRVTSPGMPDRRGTVRLRINAEAGVAPAMGTTTVFQGNAGSVTVTPNREGGYTGPVTVTLTNLPAGVTANPVTSASGTTVTVPLTIAENATVGAGNIVASVSGTGIETRTAINILTVNNTLLSATPLAIADSRARFNFRVYRVNVPAGATQLRVVMAGGTGDADIYLIPPGAIDPARAVCAPFAAGNNETCTIANPAAGTWYAYIEVWDPYAGATLAATVTGGAAIRAGDATLVPVLPIAELQAKRAVEKGN